jgi:plasmid stabilization system protein ParE
LSAYLFTPVASRDLEAIWQYIARDSVRHADLVEEAILATCRFAAEMDGVGHRREDVGKPKVLFLTVSDYKRDSIAYLSGTSPLRIVRVVHGSRDVPRLLR